MWFQTNDKVEITAVKRYRRCYFKCQAFIRANALGPVPQTPIKLILDQWKILIAIYLPLKKDFSQE